MAKPDIDALLNTQPPNPDADIALVKQDGRPTNFYLDWLLSQTDWARTNIVKTDQRIDNVRAETDDAIADFREEVNAVIGPEGALAEQITEVEAKANGATANGQIYFAAAAAPAGAIAAYGIYLTAGDVFTGMTLVAKSDGTSAIVFDAAQFALNHSGTLENVFDYDGANFTFNVPVRVQTIDIATEAVTKPRVVTINTASSVSDSGGAWVNLISHTVQADSGTYPALIIADFMYKHVPGGAGITSGTWRLIREKATGGTEVLRSGALGLVADYFPVLTARLVSNVRDNDIFRLQATVSSTGGSTFSFDDKAILVDLRKR